MKIPILSTKQIIALVLSIIVIVIVSYFIPSTNYQDYIRKVNKKAYKTKISGVVSSIYNSHGILCIGIKDQQEEYQIPSTVSQKYSPPDLLKFLQVDDSIYKYPDSNCLKIIRGEQEYIWFLNLR